jgi:uncharacterized protein YodC (DUF2158 family)
VAERSDIQSGDTVVLKSGGPVMSVQARSQNLAYCSWFDGGILHHGTFAVDALQPDAVAPAAAALREAADAIQSARDRIDAGEGKPTATGDSRDGGPEAP